MMRRIGSAMLLLGMLTGQAVAADTRHDGTWTGTYHPVQALGAKCNTNTTKRSMVVKDGVATMRTTSARNGAERIYTGTVNGNSLDMVSEDELIYSGTFSGNHYRATTGRGLCTNGIDLDRVP